MSERRADWKSSTQDLDDEIERLRAENARLRELLWLRHGCEVTALYGDDGERSCGDCRIDFKRMTPAEIEARLIALGKARLAAELEGK